MSIGGAGREEEGSHSQAPQLEQDRDKEQEHQGSAAGQGPGAGLLGVFGGKWCRLTLYLEQITLPLGGLGVAGVAASSARAGPVKYHAVYTLPGWWVGATLHESRAIAQLSTVPESGAESGCTVEHIA
ncbi:hypothetical protein HaLaN_21574 [Haematococcus lacustris]|uniref:Uncharacterized protein n=1 Tax=Haematococcus lacustris TaxID=44745 RepID=A0A6A0A2V9_HAELA|nr:hypothetical protein HaLaN_21574 [Haematococcus lacustris]